MLRHYQTWSTLWRVTVVALQALQERYRQSPVTVAQPPTSTSPSASLTTGLLSLTDPVSLYLMFYQFIRQALPTPGDIRVVFPVSENLGQVANSPINNE